MRRFSLTHTPRKAIGMQSAVNRSQAVNETRTGRIVRDKEFKSRCVATIAAFLTKNGYEGNTNLNNPSTKEFQNVLRFIVAFIDASISSKFEEDVIFLIKTLKYPYSNEITRSQLTSITPHALPSLLGMMAWLTEVIEKSTDIPSPVSLDSLFFTHCCNEYDKFMNNEEDDACDDAFLNNVREKFTKETEEIQALNHEIELLENDTNVYRTAFDEHGRLQNKKGKLLHDINAIVAYEKQVEQKKAKYIDNIESVLKNIKEIQVKVDELEKKKADLRRVISEQDLNVEDINELTGEKQKLIKDIERINNENDEQNKVNLKVSEQVETLENEAEKLTNEISAIRGVDKSSLKLNLNDFENLLIKSKEEFVKFELGVKNLEERMHELMQQEDDIGKEYTRMEKSLKSLGNLYDEKKNTFDQNYEESLAKLDKQTRDMLNLKLSCDYIVENSERELNDAKIKHDTLQETITAERDVIEKALLDLASFMETTKKGIAAIENELNNL